MSQPQQHLPQNLQRAKKLASLLDAAVTVPVVNAKIGLDPILGLIPGGGDAAMVVLSFYILWVGIELNLPRKVLGRMLVNILVDALVGSIPVLGDAFDAVFKANQLNVELMEKAYLEKIAADPGVQVIDVEVKAAVE
ncbi:MAG: DUF4112 domain-containing protein [Vampirovibrio sp.]|nr:DUF4112 domain-containing protein [Vampirovibrio sp.]